MHRSSAHGSHVHASIAACRFGAVVVLAALGACFNPTYPENLPCDPEGWCPPGQTCNPINNLCVVAVDGDGGVEDGPPAPFAVAIDIGADTTMNVGDTLQFTVTEVYSDGARVSVPADELVIWRSTDNGVVWLDSYGLATAESAGAATVTGRYQGLADAAEVTVVAP